jgi:hypothetical protein
MSSRRVVVGAVACALGGALALAVWHRSFINDPSPSSSMSPSEFVRPEIPSNVSLQQNASMIERNVRRSLGGHSVITSVRVVARRSELGEALIGGTGPEFEHGGPAWIVRARGLFRPVTIPPGGHFTAKLRSGYVVIDDATGQTLAYGFG